MDMDLEAKKRTLKELIDAMSEEELASIPGVKIMKTGDDMPEMPEGGELSERAEATNMEEPEEDMDTEGVDPRLADIMKKKRMAKMPKGTSKEF